MTADRWNQVVEIFSAVVDRAPGQQRAYLDEACARDPDLRAQVEELLANHAIAEAEGFLKEAPWVIDEIPAFLPDFEEYKQIVYVGHGGMGVVYKAFDESLDTHIALKVSLPRRLTTAEDISRFRIDPQSMAKLKHPNIVQVHKVGEFEGVPYFTMNLIEGKDGSVSSAEQLARFRGDPAAAATLMIKVARAVHHAHQRGILHRDLKPGNILLDDEGNPHITDFGLAKRIGGDEELTETGERLNAASVAYRGIVGTVKYMAPEQADPSPNREVTTLSDVYGLGATLYTLLTGQPPFQADTLEETLQLVRDPAQKPMPPRELNPRMDRSMESICLKCLNKDPIQRYRSAEEFAKNLECWLHQEPIDPPQPSWVRCWNWCRRNPLGAGLTATAVLLLIAVVLLVHGEQTHWEQEAQARQAGLNKEEDDFHAGVKTKSLEIASRFSHYEKLLAELRGSAAIVLTSVEPDKDEPIVYARPLKASIYDKPAVFVVRSAIAEKKTLQRLMLLSDPFKQTMVRSRNRKAGLPPPTDDEIRELLTKTTGTPLTWIYVALKEGLDCTYPGNGDFPDKYDPRDRPWYNAAARLHLPDSVIWVGPYNDALGKGRMFSCSGPIYDYNNNFLGVVCFDLLEDFVISDILKITEQRHVHAYLVLKTTKQTHVDEFLVDGRRKALVPVKPGELQAEVVEHIKEGKSGHVRTDDKLVAYFPLHVSDWYYVVVADSDHIQEILDSMQGEQNGSQ